MFVRTSIVLLALNLGVASCTNSQSDKEKKEEQTQESKSQQLIKQVDISEASKLIEEIKDLVVIDLRTDAELKNGHLKDAHQINFKDKNFKNRIENLDTSESYLIYCHSGGRSGKTREIMKKSGFQEVYDMQPGFGGWEAAGQPLYNREDRVNVDEKTLKEFQEKINDSGYVFINFYASWCGICKKNRPMLTNYESDRENVQLLELDVDQNRGLRNHFEVTSIPTLIVYKDGEMQKSISGALKKSQIQKVTTQKK